MRNLFSSCLPVLLFSRLVSASPEPLIRLGVADWLDQKTVECWGLHSQFHERFATQGGSLKPAPVATLAEKQVLYVGEESGTVEEFFKEKKSKVTVAESEFPALDANTYDLILVAHGSPFLEKDGSKAVLNWYRALKRGGSLRVGVASFDDMGKIADTKILDKVQVWTQSLDRAMYEMVLLNSAIERKKVAEEKLKECTPAPPAPAASARTEEFLIVISKR